MYANQLVFSIRFHYHVLGHLCEECGRSFKSARNLDTHKKSSIHSVATIQCPQCPKKFNLQSELKRHRSLHTAINYVCEHCGKRLSSLDGYRTHTSAYRFELVFECVEMDSELNLFELPF